MALADEIVATLSPLRSLRVLTPAPGSVVPAHDCTLDGNLHAIGDRLRVAMRLSDLTEGGAILWSAVMEGEAHSKARLLEDVAARTGANVDHQLLFRAARRATAASQPDSPAADLVMRAVPDLYRLDRDRFMAAGKLLTRAVLRDGEFGMAHAWLALWNVLLVGQGWARNEREAMARAGAAAERAVTLDPRDARALTLAGHVRAFLHRQVAAGLSLHRRALEINPSLPLAWTLSGIALTYGGELNEARRHLRQAQRLLPHDPHGFFAETGLAVVALLLGEHEEAARLAQGVLQMQPRFTATLKVRLSALGHLGRTEEAGPYLTRLLELEPQFTVGRFRAGAPYAKREHLEHFARGLRLAGLP